MYIKQVIIQGFRSYRDQTIIEPFSPKHNVVIGRNGSGKSNFFLGEEGRYVSVRLNYVCTAIQFVLSDEFNHMRPEERQQLLHEGTGPRVVSAYVEIIFDNSDNRIPIEKEEVSVRRVIGAKKDTYHLDGKMVPKADIMNLLESAGFSRSNPYYIVKQGKINQLALAPDSQRLKLLREVAGTRVYDERKEESKTILAETEGKRGKIEEMLQYIEERLSTLEEEKEELKAYQELDKQRRSLEYTIHDKELRDTREKLEQLEEARQGNKEGSKGRHDKVAEAQAQIETLEREHKDVTGNMHSMTSEREQLREEDQELVKQRAKLEFDVKDLEEGMTEDQKKREQYQKELAQLEGEIRQKQAELNNIMPQYQQHKNQEERLGSRLKGCEQRRSELFAKQGRGQQFTSGQERDVWIKKEAKSLSASIQGKDEQTRKLRCEVEELKQKVANQEQELKERGDDTEQRRSSIDRANKEYAQLKLKRDDLTNQRKELWRKEAGTDQSLQTIRDELSKAERNLRGTMGKAISRGLDAVKKVVEERKITGVYGPLIENFKCEPRVFTAVEVTAGSRLFHIIVDSDKTASQILSQMNKQKLPGEVTFLPLNKLQSSPLQHSTSRDALPMIEQLQYDPMFLPAISQIFGKTLICRDMDKAAQYSKSENLDCITLEGDQVSRKGALTGGYYDTRMSRLEQQRLVNEHTSRLAEMEREKAELKRQLEDLDGQVTHILGEIQKVETKQIQLRETYERQKLDVRLLSQELQSNKKALEPKERMLVNLESDMQSMQSALAALQGELGTEMQSQLDSGDQREVDKLTEDIQSLQQQIRSCLAARTQLESQKNVLDNLLTNNLMRRRDELAQEIEELSLVDRRQQLEMQTASFEHICGSIEHTRSRLEEVEAAIDVCTRRLREIDTSLDKWKAAERENQEAINEEAKTMEKLAGKRSFLLKKKEESMKKIRELGSLPADAFDKYQNLQLSQLWKKLEKCNRELKKYSHVNKKALDQFVLFSDQKVSLIERKEQLDRDYQAILELMEVLEQRKHEAIQFTFKQVSKNFSEVFAELVPHGKAQLVMKRAVDGAPPVEEEEDGEEEAVGEESSTQEDGAPKKKKRKQKKPDEVDLFTGVSIQVSFTGQNSETKELQQLSGGQKSLVALAMIFAIQKCDPAPFYLFDEIDQALDSHHRHSVAAMIHRLADSAQFITTTFRPELLESADKFYGVKFSSKSSYHINTRPHPHVVLMMSLFHVIQTLTQIEFY
ncbi:hypothetical protein EMCRGX_G028721 [Ephydatia muelleri]